MSKKKPESVQSYGSIWSLLAAVIFAVGAGALFYTAQSQSTLCPSEYVQPNFVQLEMDSELAVPVDIRSLRIDGTPTPDGKDPKLPVAIMIDNHPDARPQYGLNNASIVYESLVEGGFTRYLAVFQNAETDVIGPVRSARDYFLPFVAEWNADFAHAGGSPKALADIKKYSIKNIEEISYLGPDYFLRSSRRRAPHNLYTHTEHMNNARERLKFPSEINFNNWTPWQFVPTGAFAQTNNAYVEAKQINVEWSFRTSADVSFVYDNVTRSYERFLGGETDIDALVDKPINASTVILMHVPQERVLDSAGRLDIDVIGSGNVDVFSEGVRVSGTWNKETYDARTTFVSKQDGNEIVFTPGLVWIMLVPEGTEVDY